MPSGNEEIKFQQNCWQPTAISQKQTPAANENTVILETDEPSVPHQDTAFLQDQLSLKNRVITATLTKTWIITLRNLTIFTSKRSHKQKPNSPAGSRAFGKHCRKHQELAMHYSILGTDYYFVLLIKGRGGGMLPSPFQECFICGQPYRSVTQLYLLAALSVPDAIMHQR